jgi:hypothetical protein
LIVERYKGKIEIKDRVPGDYKKGTTVEIWLRGAQPEKNGEDNIQEKVTTRAVTPNVH